MIKIALSLFLYMSFAFVNAQEVRYLNRSPQALLMGDAYTSLGNDEYSLFYNPATLARNSGVELYFLNPQFGATNVLDHLERFEDFPQNDAVEINNRLQGFPVHVQLGAMPGFKIGSFGLSYLVSSTTNLVIKNQTDPTLDIDYRYDRGFVMGYAHTFGHRGARTSVGVGFKYMNREGVDTVYDLFGTKLLNDINNGLSDVKEIREAIGYSRGKGFGFDLGLLHSLKVGGSELNFAASVMDIADTRFSVQSGAEKIPMQKMSLNLGSSWIQNFGLFKTTFSFDLHPLNQPISFGRKIHLGFKASLPLIDLMVGFNGGYLSYGVGIELWPIQLMAGMYAVETGAEYGQERANRGILYLSLLNIDFDL